MKNAKRSDAKPNPAVDMSVGDYLEWRLANMAGNGEFSDFGAVSSAGAARHILDEYISANGGLVRWSR